MLSKSNNVKELLQQALALYRAGDYLHAINVAMLACKKDANHFDVLHLLAVSHMALHHFFEAEQYFNKALQLLPKNAECIYNLANLYKEQKKFALAVEQYQIALQYSPRDINCLVNCANVYAELKAYDKAQECYKKALVVDPNDLDALLNFANLKRELGDDQEAETLYKKAIAVKSDHVEAHNNLGLLYQDRGMLEKAEIYFEQALEIQPDYTGALLNLGLLALLEGDFLIGLKGYQYRDCVLGRSKQKKYVQKIGQVGNLPDLKNKKIVIFSEQGVGDNVQFVRYAKLLKELNVTIIFVCQASMVDLIQVCPWIDNALSDSDLGAAVNDADYALFSGDLMQLFQTRYETIPVCTPYLSATKNVNYKKSSDDLVIGIAWKSVAKKVGCMRSIALEKLHKLNISKKIKWVDLQYGDTAAEREQVKNKQGFDIYHDDSIDQLKSLQDFANQVAACDLIISIDNTTVHVAGALNKPCWVLLQRIPDWRWMLDREDSPWYPSLKLFRQSEKRDWNEVIDNVAKELKKLISNT